MPAWAPWSRASASPSPAGSTSGWPPNSMSPRASPEESREGARLALHAQRRGAADLEHGGAALRPAGADLWRGRSRDLPRPLAHAGGSARRLGHHRRGEGVLANEQLARRVPLAIGRDGDARRRAEPARGRHLLRLWQSEGPDHAEHGSADGALSGCEPAALCGADRAGEGGEPCRRTAGRLRASARERDQPGDASRPSRSASSSAPSR